MTDSLVFDLVEWVAKQDRPYAEVMETWRTSCPRLTIWEDAVDRGLVERKTKPGGRVVVTVTAEGRKFLADRQRAARGKAVELHPMRLS
jgi:predicted transcriptional regulator